MDLRPLLVACALSIPLSQIACSRSPIRLIKNKVPLTKVTGTILVDGTETSGVLIRYKPQGEIAEKREMFTSGFTVRSTSNGRFALKTYEFGDGLPAGEYQLYCEYFPAEGEDPRRTASEDVLGGKYSDEKTPAKVFTVMPGKPLDLGTIELQAVPKN